MTPLRLSVTLLGRELLVVDLGAVRASEPVEPAPSEDPGQPDGECPGPITDRSGAPITQIGFTGRQRSTAYLAKSPAGVIAPP